MDDPRIGTTYSHFRIDGLLGKGGMGAVYRSVDTRLERPVALKVLLAERAADPAFRERFLREARVLASIEHPNIVTVYDFGEWEDQLWLAMKYVAGSELRAIIEQEGALSPERAVGIVAQIASALDAAHAAGLVHRDVKPGNIVVVPGVDRAAAGTAYLTDFGLTKVSAAALGGPTQAQLTIGDQFVGTPGYAAPEQIEANRPIDHRADVYALGCVLFNCLTGSIPYPRDSTLAVLWAHVWEPPPRVSDLRPECAAFDDVVARALAKDPGERFQTAGALAAAAQRALAQLTATLRPAASAGYTVVDRLARPGASPVAQAPAVLAAPPAATAPPAQPTHPDTPASPLPPEPPVTHTFRSARRRSRAVMAGLAVVGLVGALSLAHAITGLGVIDRAAILRASELEAYDRQSVLLALALLISLLLAAIPFLAWFSRLVDNVPTLGLGTPTATPRAAIGWWFVPIASYWKPGQIALDLERRLRPADSRPSVLVGSWWAAWLAAGAAGIVTRYLPTSTLSDLRTTLVFETIGDILWVIAAALAILVVARLQGHEDARAGLEAPSHAIWARLPRLTAVATTVAIVVALIGGTLTVPGGSSIAAIGPSATPIASPAPAATPGPSPSASPTPVFGSDARQAALLQIVPPSLRATCEQEALVGREVASVRCAATGLDSIIYDQYESRVALDQDWAELAGEVGVRSDVGSCAEDQSAEHLWPSGSAGQGRYLCDASGDPVLVWTDYGTLARMWIFGGSVAALYSRWTDRGDLGPLTIGTAADVSRLRDLVAEPIRDTCEAVGISGRQLAALSCTMEGVSSLTYVSFGSREDLDEDWAAILKRFGVEADSGYDCQKDQTGEIYWYWEDPKQEEGRVACARPDGTPTVSWTDASRLVRMTIEGKTLAQVDTAWLDGDFLNTPTPAPTPTSTSTPTPTPTPTPPPDRTAPTGGSATINGGKNVTTSFSVKVALKKPSDPSGITHYLISNSSSRPSTSSARAITTPVNWELAKDDGLAGSRTIYVWFRDGAGNWSTKPVSDSITFDNPPVATNTVTFNGICSTGDYTFDLLANPPYVATDKDGVSTIRVVKVWNEEGTDLSGGISADGRKVTIHVNVTPGPFDIKIHFTVQDDPKEKDDGWFRITNSGCPF